MKNLLFVFFLFLIQTTVFSQAVPTLEVFISETSGHGCSNQTNCVDGLLCFDVKFKVNQSGWLLQSYNIWIDYGPDNDVLSFASEDPCYHQKGGAVNLDTYGKYRFLSANFGLLLPSNKKITIQNFCVNIDDFSELNKHEITAGGVQFGLVSSANLVSESNGQNAVNPYIDAKSLTLNKNTISCLKIAPNARMQCTNNGVDLLSMAQDATGSTIPNDCEPYTYLWKGPNGFTSTEANPQIDFSNTAITSGDFTLKVVGINGCIGKSKFCFNRFNCNSSANRTVTAQGVYSP